MKNGYAWWLLFFIIVTVQVKPLARSYKKTAIHFFGASDSKFQYVGRIDFSNPKLPRFWAPGVYIKASFTGSSCEIEVIDEQKYGKNHNYISVLIDSLPVKRIKLKDKLNKLVIADGLKNTRHNLTIVKSTEAGIGYLEFSGITCDKLVNPPALPERRIEFIGNSITCGTGSDLSEYKCDTGEWYDQHNAFKSYGPLTAMALTAQWQLTAVSGIGLTRSCCNMKLIMPDVFDKVSLGDNSIIWDFSKYQPDVVTICLGQNDGIVDSVSFCSAYCNFINRLRQYYHKATLICLTSPMADSKLVKVQQNYLRGITKAVNEAGDDNVYHYYFSKRYQNGCGGHPDLAEHQQISEELAAYIKKIKKW